MLRAKRQAVIYQHLFFGVISFRMAKSDVSTDCPSRNREVGWAKVFAASVLAACNGAEQRVYVRGRYRPVVCKVRLTPSAGEKKQEDLGDFSREG